ncbi:5557d668-eaed-47d8-b611-5f358e83b5df [Thermothielavioides terrestris]|uniref:5557d668-eaed-47d8-b611-5f358e83b5df n=1 Tax=Thermothielavioides terrestris TaxID=2587410 RepID=A0A446BV03_9PEZI|nr:5557d668-eaed-47d8-b611-5f358e83b5df [Thermothielavioides terrestris]
MATSTRPPANRFVAMARRVYNPIGFSKGYNFVLFFIFAGALVGFTLARFQYLSLDKSCFSGPGAGPLDCYYYTDGSVDRLGIFLHLATILPAALLACVQFVPAIRHKAILLHRINGYLVILLSLISTAGAIMLARNAVGGRTEVQSGVGVLSIAFVVSLALALYNVKRLQIEQHRAWMLRAWFYAGSVITLRIILVLSALIISTDGYFVPMPCDKVAFLVGSEQETLQAYPDCYAYFSGDDVNRIVLVPASFQGNKSNVTAALSRNFGGALWLALALHAVGVEIYVSNLRRRLMLEAVDRRN